MLKCEANGENRMVNVDFSGGMKELLVELGAVMTEIHRLLPPEEKETFRRGLNALAGNPDSPVYEDMEE